jgi:hypothetical protein
MYYPRDGDRAQCRCPQPASDKATRAAIPSLLMQCSLGSAESSDTSAAPSIKMETSSIFLFNEGVIPSQRRYSSVSF